jgi:hypothetical protein
LAKSATTQKSTIVVKRTFDRENAWNVKWLARREGVLRDWVLEDTGVDSRLHVATKDRRPDEWDPPVEPYDPYGPGEEERCPRLYRQRPETRFSPTGHA